MALSEAKQKAAAKAFAKYWEGKGYEKGESQPFWLSLLRDVFGVDEPEKYIKFEDQVKLDTSTGFIDGFISETHVMIEQKGAGKDLNKPIKQSDGSLLNPFQQAKRYSAELPYSERPRWIITCNFREFYVYDMEKPHGDPEKIKLADLEKEYYRLSFLVEKGSVHLQREMEVSIKAGEVVGLLYDGLLKQYKNPEDPETRRSGGMHYTSIENIHKVIDPLFLNDLKAELEEIKAVPVWKTKEKSLLAFQKKLASLEFLEIKTPFLIQIATPQAKGVQGWLNCA